MMDMKDMDALLREIDRKVSVLFAADAQRRVDCPHQLQRIDHLERTALEFENREVYKRISVMEKAVVDLQKCRDQEKASRKLIVGLLLALGALVSWGFDVGPKLITLVRHGIS